MKKIIAITGVTKGLSYELMHRFIEQGWTVIGSGRSDAKIEALSKSIGSEHHFSVLDVSDPKAVSEWVDTAVAKVGVPKIVINNAVIINRNNSLWNIDDAEFQQVMDINICGTFFVAKYFLPYLLGVDTLSSVIVNLSSGWGCQGAADVTPYCASKFAVEGLTQSLAKELPTYISTVTLDPGGINTEMLQSVNPGYAGQAAAPLEWSKQACKFILSISQKENGKALRVPL